MSMQEIESEVEFMDNGDTTVVVVDDEAYNLSGSDVEIHEADDEVLLITADEVYRATYDEDGWMIVGEDIPETVLRKLEELDIRYADAEAYGFPIEFQIGFRSDEAVFRTSWQKEVLRPSMDVADKIQGSIREVTLSVSVDEDGSITVTDVDLWPNKPNVSIDI